MGLLEKIAIIFSIISIILGIITAIYNFRDYKTCKEFARKNSQIVPNQLKSTDLEEGEIVIITKKLIK